MNRITADMTALGELNPELTPDVILSGERIEFDPEAKLNKKIDYVQFDFAVKIVNAYADDLLSAYRAIEELERENDELRGQLAEARKAAQESGAQVKQMLSGDKKFADAEKLLARFEQQLDILAKDKQADKSTIANLSSQVRELAQLRDTVPQLEADVNAVLDHLRSYFAEEGMDIPDFAAEYDDDYGDDYKE